MASDDTSEAVHTDPAGCHSSNDGGNFVFQPPRVAKDAFIRLAASSQLRGAAAPQTARRVLASA